MDEDEKIQVGKVKHYFAKIGVAVVELHDTIKVGDKIHIKGKTTDFKQSVKSMQIEYEKVEVAESGSSIGLKVEKPVRESDVVYKLI